jgi:MinD-like ATPase involved in chromosome partitioning or flagellar assembly
MQPDVRRPGAPTAHIPPAVASARVALVASGKGGVGTSVVASLLALGAAAAGARVLLIDGHEGSGVLHHLFGVRPNSSLDALRNASVSLDEVLIPLGERFSVVASKPASDDQLALSPEARRAPFERLLPLTSDYDCVVVDGGSRLESLLAVTSSGAGRAVVVTDADRISLAANYALLKVLAQRAPSVLASVLVNRHDEAVALRAGAQLADACSRFIDCDVSLAGAVPDDACLRAALGAGMPIGDAADGSPAAGAMQALALRVFPFLTGARADARAAFPTLRRRS